MSEAYRKTNKPAPINTRPMTINPILRRPVRGRLVRMLPKDSEPASPILYQECSQGNKGSIRSGLILRLIGSSLALLAQGFLHPESGNLAD